MSVPKAIRIGELLTKIDAALDHGDWLPWLKDNVKFSDQCARNYMRLYEKRDDPEFKKVLNLSEAYRLLRPKSQPKETPGFKWSLLPPHDIYKSVQEWDRKAPLWTKEYTDS